MEFSFYSVSAVDSPDALSPAAQTDKGTFLSNLNQRLLRPAKPAQKEENATEILGVGSREGKREFDGWNWIVQGIFSSLAKEL